MVAFMCVHVNIGEAAHFCNAVLLLLYSALFPHSNEDDGGLMRMMFRGC